MDGLLMICNRTMVLIIIELCWLTFPSTEGSSWSLVTAHAFILVGLFMGANE